MGPSNSGNAGGRAESRSGPPRAPRIPAWLGVVAVLLAFVAGILGSIESVRGRVIALVGPEGFQVVHNIMTALVGALLVFGLVVLAVHAALLARPYGRRAVAVAAILGGALATSALAYVSPIIFPPAPATWRKVVDSVKVSWSEEVVRLSKKENGCLRVHRTDPKSITQVWSTAQYLTGMLATQTPLDTDEGRAVHDAFACIEAARRPGGWGYSDSSAHPVVYINAWVALAYIRALSHPSVAAFWSPQERTQAMDRLAGDLDALAATKLPDGSMPAFTDIDSVGSRLCSWTYSSAMALWALADARREPVTFAKVGKRYDRTLSDGALWLLGSYDQGIGGWRAFPEAKETKRHDGLNAQALLTLSLIDETTGTLGGNPQFAERLRRFFATPNLASVDFGEDTRVFDGDVSGHCGGDREALALTFLKYPWILALASEVAASRTLPGNVTRPASDVRDAMALRFKGFADYATNEWVYITGEGLTAITRFHLQ